MKLTAIRVKYNGLLAQAKQATPERAAYLNIYYCLRGCIEKKKAIPCVRKLLNQTEDEGVRKLYQEALDLLETPHNAEREN